MEKDKRLKEQELEIRTLNAQKRVDTKKIKELELEVRKLQSNELKTKKYKSEVPNHRRGDLSDDSDKEESGEPNHRCTRYYRFSSNLQNELTIPTHRLFSIEQD